MEFVDAAYIPSKGGAGRPAGPNPYTDVIKAIALKKDPAGKPVAKAVVLDAPYGTEAADKAVAAAKRLQAKAGHANIDAEGKALPVTVPSKATEYKVPNAKGTGLVIDKTKTLLTFWTAPKQNRPKNVTPPTTK